MDQLINDYVIYAIDNKGVTRFFNSNYAFSKSMLNYSLKTYDNIKDAEYNAKLAIDFKYAKGIKVGQVKDFPQLLEMLGDARRQRAKYNKAYKEANNYDREGYNKSYYRRNKEKARVYQKAYKEANKERLKEESKRYYEANKERISAYNKAYREANKERLNGYGKEYYHENKEDVRTYKRGYYQRKKQERRLNEIKEY